MNDLIAVPGFTFSGVSCGIKTEGALDLGIVYIPNGATLAGVYTQNQIVAAPVVLSRKAAKERRAHAIVVNSGNANACTGEVGHRDALAMARDVSERLALPLGSVQVCSTGVIGQTLPMPQVLDGIAQACDNLSPEHAHDFAEAIRTTDLYRKTVSEIIRIEGTDYHIQGIAKGAGMIAPDMATMLAFIFTDAPVSGPALQEIWQRICNRTFNAMSVDGDTSTNDTALILCSGDESSALSGEALERFEASVLNVCDELAHLIVGDGEGATKAVRITVSGARSPDDAKTIANVIARSPLVKTALHGEDPNWGRIIAAAGRSGVTIEPEKLELCFDDQTLYQHGQWCGIAAEKAVCKVMQQPRYEIVLNLHLGKEYASVLTCDLTAEYVRINADYRS